MTIHLLCTRNQLATSSLVLRVEFVNEIRRRLVLGFGVSPRQTTSLLQKVVIEGISAHYKVQVFQRFAPRFTNRNDTTLKRTTINKGLGSAQYKECNRTDQHLLVWYYNLSYRGSDREEDSLSKRDKQGRMSATKIAQPAMIKMYVNKLSPEWYSRRSMDVKQGFEQAK